MLLVEISTKNRVRELGRCLACLLDQTYNNFDILVINDNPQVRVDSNEVTKEWLLRHSAIRMIKVIDGSGIDQAHNHNIPLWDYNYRAYDYILRLDDDVLLNRTAIDQMVKFIDLNPDVVGVSGLWFENELGGDLYDRAKPLDWGIKELQGKVIDGVCSNWHQRVYHLNDVPQRVEHLYGPCLYRADAMRKAGGWPEILTPGVAHGEETDGTFRLAKFGKLFVLPGVTANHLKTSGGIRGTKNLGFVQAIDGNKLMSRLLAMPGKWGKLNVGVRCDHTDGIGGAQKQYYELISLLQKYCTVYNISPVKSNDFLKTNFGVELEPFPDAVPHVFDVIIDMTHDIDTHTLPLANAKVAYIFFPEGKGKNARQYDMIVGNSRFTATHITQKWGVNAEYIYPYVEPYNWPIKTKLPNSILIVGRLDPFKAPLWLAEKFVKNVNDGKLPADSKLTIVGATTNGVYQAYEDQLRNYVSAHPNVALFEDVSEEGLIDMYDYHQVVWCGKGVLATEEFPNEAEHFGYIPLEAINHGCIPVAYDFGGHKETVSSNLRWADETELIELTSKVFASPTDYLFERFSPTSRYVCSWSRYELQWLRAVFMANAKTVQLDSNPAISVNKVLTVGAITDSPRLFTGFSVIGREAYKAFKDLNLHVVGLMDNRPASPGEFDYTFWPVDGYIDKMGEHNVARFLQEANLDVLWLCADPGTLWTLTTTMGFRGIKIPTVVYFPIEGVPINRSYGMLVQNISQAGGRAFTYSKAAADAIKRQFSNVVIDYAYHGADHDDFRPYAESDREMLRRLAGLDGKFVIGNIGVNKRTKEQPTLIYVAKYLRDIGKDQDIVFYVHCNPTTPILQGYYLEDLADYYGVRDMFLFKPEDNIRIRTPYKQDTLEWVGKMTVPPTPQQRGYLFANYDIISKINCFDMYLDVSSVEGWNLPVIEAMKCGIPTVTVDDGLTRTEIFTGGAIMMQPLDTPATWHTGSRLAMLDIKKVANHIIAIKNDSAFKRELADMAYAQASKYSWFDFRKKMREAVESV